MTDNLFQSVYDEASQPQQNTQNQQISPPTTGTGEQNLFASVYDEANTPKQQQQQDPSRLDPGVFMAGVASFNNFTDRVATNALMPIYNALGVGKEAQQYKQQSDQAAQTAHDFHPIVSDIAGVAGAMPMTTLAAAGSYGALAPTVEQIPGLIGSHAGTLTNAIAGGLPTAIATDGSMAQKTIAGGIGAGLGVAGGYLGGKIADFMSPTAEGMSSSASRMMNGAKAAANDVGVIANAKQGIQDLIDSSKVPNIKDIQSKFYDDVATKTSLSTDTVDALKQNPILNKYMDGITSDPTSASHGLPDNSLAKWDAVKQSLQDDLYGQQGINKNLSTDQLKGLMQTHNQLIATLDSDPASQSVGYKDIRQMGEKNAIYNQLTSGSKSLGSKPDIPMSNSFPSTINKDGSISPPSNVTTNKSVGTLINTIAGSPDKKALFLDQVQKAGGNPTNAENLINTLGKLQTARPEVLTASATKNPASAALAEKPGTINSIVNGSYNKEVVKLALSGPDQQAQLAKVLSQPNQGKLISGLHNMLQSVKNSSIGQIATNTLKTTAPIVGPAIAGGYLGNTNLGRVGAILGAEHIASAPMSKVNGYLKE